MLRYAVLAGALMATTAVQAAPRDQMLVTPAWLAAHAKDANLVILHAGEKADFDAKHIPGAVLALGGELAPNIPGGLLAQMPTAEELRNRLAALGVSDRSRIVVYSARDMPYATRVLFTLDAAGLGRQASLLDGGLAEWERAGQPTTAQTRTVKPGVLSSLKMKAAVVDADFIQKMAKPPRYDVIDARAAVYYDGVQAGSVGPNGPTKGHVPGAKSLPFNTVVDARGKLKPAAELQSMFKAAGVSPGDKLVAYCHIGYQATAVIYAARSLGIDAVLYDGSFQDWAGRGLPIELAAPGR
jgi:thiosulfate/3-mercaptopyruvate sulfurtransferase